MADQIILGRALDENGEIVPAALAHFYAVGTDTPVTVYADQGAATPQAQPVGASSAGVFPQVFTTQPVKVLITTPEGAALPGYPQDPAYMSLSRSGSAGGIPFTPYPGNGGASIAAEDVQSAIEELADEFADVQAGAPNLTALAGLTGAPNKVPRFTGAGEMGLLDFLDEDDMASDSAAAVPSQQSVRAFVNTRIAQIETRPATATDATGTAVDFTGIVAARRVQIMLSQVSTSGTSNIILQIGPTAGVETTSYDSMVEFNGNSDTATAGFILTRLTGAADSFSGIITLLHLGGNVWVQQGGLANGGFSAGRKALAGTLSALRITTEGGTDTFDAGKINIIYG